jgi:DNA topoisomerase-1
VIGDDIRNRTAEEMNLGTCPVCKGTLAIKHLRGNTQFIGCSRYPECTFNIGLPMAQWGFAVRTDEVCDKHHLNFVRLVRKGARPWDIGCPLCHHINSNAESLAEIPSMNEDLAQKILTKHIYTVAELARSNAESLAQRLDLPVDAAKKLISDAGSVLEKLRRRSECRKFMRDHLIPRKGRSYAKILTALKSAGITELSGLVHADISMLKAAGIGEEEAVQVLTEAKAVYYGQVLREIGIPAVSLKKYVAAGITSPEAFCTQPPESLSKRTGMSQATVNRHVELVCTFLKKPVPKKYSKPQLERGKKELLAIRGIDKATYEKLSRAGIINTSLLLEADSVKVAADTGIMAHVVQDLKKAIQKKRDNAVIEI